MRKKLIAFAALLLFPALPAGAIQLQYLQRTEQEDIWQPAATPPGGTSWRVLEATREITRTDAEGYIISRPEFTDHVRRLEGQRIKVAGWMDAFEPGRRQTHFVLLGYPPGCPFHWHAAPNQFIEVKASTAFPLSDEGLIVVEGVLELTGEDESGIFYVLNNARPA
ncbi:DUF3299 domain-containing protein [Alteraurantiacibacter aquimixticola]|uniref:DUF3299 domain-containing protein n=1 Tax=Alteraurantiacibacter aquimixticola TaxID=2489173 RepID=A0A4T3F4G8_9SPHN|nr:DUF3299 domain-containing protein [Alteraurantiacibacter aquimixticola]TIX51681.1 DUF3299 domain-containing protein [Alteraurantiacibacter aquimixticola]